MVRSSKTQLEVKLQKLQKYSDSPLLCSFKSSCWEPSDSSNILRSLKDGDVPYEDKNTRLIQNSNTDEAKENMSNNSKASSEKF